MPESVIQKSSSCSTEVFLEVMIRYSICACSYTYKKRIIIIPFSDNTNGVESRENDEVTTWFS